MSSWPPFDFPSDHEISNLLEELKMRMIGSVDKDHEEIVQLLHSGDGGLIELICSVMERDRVLYQLDLLRSS